MHHRTFTFVVCGGTPSNGAQFPSHTAMHATCTSDSAMHLMHIQVQDEHALHSSFLQQHRGGDGKVVEDAEARAGGRERVVRAAGCVACKAVLQCQPSRQQRA